MPDIRDVQVGDEIEITLKFKARLTETYVGHSSGVDGIYLGKNLDPSLYTLKIIPKPLAVGDEVQTIYTGRTCHIVAIDGNAAWVKYGDGSHTTFNLNDLKKKDNCNCD